MYEENTAHAIEAMDDEGDLWGIHSSPLTFAYENFMYDVVAHTCSQKNMNKQWYNNLAPDLKPFMKVSLTFFMQFSSLFKYIDLYPYFSIFGRFLIMHHLLHCNKKFVRTFLLV